MRSVGLAIAGVLADQAKQVALAKAKHNDVVEKLLPQCPDESLRLSFARAS